METVSLSLDLVDDFGDGAPDPSHPSFGGLRRAVADLLRDPQIGDALVRELTLALQLQTDAAGHQLDTADQQVPKAARPIIQPKLDRAWAVLQQMEEVLEILSVWLEEPPKMDVLAEILVQLDAITGDAAAIFEQLATATAQ